MEETKEHVNQKRIEVIELPVGELRHNFPNPRKQLKSKKRKELEESLEQLGDFGVIVINENNDIISGNQRCKILFELNPSTPVLCKRLIGYSVSEQRAINIKANTHAGEWDLDMLAEWTSDLNVSLDFNVPIPDVEDSKIKDMELVRYEKYDYVVIACRNEIDYLALTRALGIDGKKCLIAKGKSGERKIKARAIWYEEMNAQIIPK